MQKSEKAGFYLFFLLLFSVSLVPFGYLSSSFHRYAISGLALLLLYVYRHGLRVDEFNLSLLAIVAALCASAAAGVDRGRSFSFCASFLLKSAAVACIARAAMKTDDNLSENLILSCVSAVSLIGIYEYAFHANPYHSVAREIGNFSLTPRSGMASTIGHPLALASFIVLALPLAYSRAARGIKTSYAYLAVLSAALLLTFSRSSWLAALLALALFLALGWKRGARRLLAPLGGLALLSTLLLISGAVRSTLAERLSPARLKTDIFGSHRAEAYRITYRILKDRPVLGVGYGNYPLVCSRYASAGDDSRLETPDNMYLRLLCELGIAGTLAFMAGLFVMLRRIWAGASGLPTIGYLAGLAGFLFNLATGDFLYWLAPQFLFFAMLGAAYSLAERRTWA